MNIPHGDLLPCKFEWGAQNFSFPTLFDSYRELLLNLCWKRLFYKFRLEGDKIGILSSCRGTIFCGMFAINLCRAIPSCPAVKRMFLLHGMENSFSCRRVFGRVPNKDVELYFVLSFRKSSRVVVRVVTVTYFDQRSIQVSSTLHSAKTIYVPLSKSNMSFSALSSRSTSVNSFLKNSMSVVISMLKSSSCGNDSNELDYTLYK